MSWVTVPEPAAGRGWTYTLEFPARLACVSAILSTGGSVADRYVVLIVDGPAGQQFAAFPATTTAQTASQVFGYTWGPGLALIDQQTDSAHANVCAPLSELWLPQGSVVLGGAVGTQTDDQWQNVVLALTTELGR